jgi:hypothetical protein
MTAERYEVLVTPMAGVVKVEAILFDESAPALSSPEAQVIVTACSGPTPCVIYVWPPNWWERWRGVTWEDKVNRAKAKVERWARERLAVILAVEAATHGERGGGGRCQPPTKS